MLSLVTRRGLCPGDCNLGLVCVPWWSGWGTGLCVSLASFCFCFEGRWSPLPHLLIIHLGANHLSLIKGKDLVMQVKADLELVRSRWPGALIGWSAILLQVV